MGHWIYDDGGRKAAGHKGIAGDCVTRSIAIATELPYQKVYDGLNIGCKDPIASPATRRQICNSSARTGIYKQTYSKFLKEIGWTWTPLEDICLRADLLPFGRLIVQCSHHLTTMIDGIIRDTHDPSREGTREAYGYFS